MTDDKATNDEQVAKISREFACRQAHYLRREVAKDVLVMIASRLDAKGCARYSVSDADVKYAVQVADMLIKELDKEGGR